MPEVLGRYSNQGARGGQLRTLRERANAEAREEPWEQPTLVGTTRVRRLLATDLDAIVADYAGGMGCVLLSRKYGIAENTVLARLKEAGVQVLPQGFVDAEAFEEMAALRAEGWTLKALGQRYGITRQTVASRLRALD